MWPASKHHPLPSRHPSPSLHAILVDDVIQKIEGNPNFADAEIERHRAEGHIPHMSSLPVATKNLSRRERSGRGCLLDMSASAH